MGLTPASMRMALEMSALKRPAEEADADSYEDQDGTWFRAAPVSAFPEGGGACVRVGHLQIAVFNFRRRGEWYACQNMCPHRREMVLSRGMLGSSKGKPKIACPFHKATFSLEDGTCLNSDLHAISTYPVRIEDDHVFIRLSADDLEGP